MIAVFSNIGNTSQFLIQLFMAYQCFFHSTGTTVLPCVQSHFLQIMALRFLCKLNINMTVFLCCRKLAFYPLVSICIGYIGITVVFKKSCKNKGIFFIRGDLGPILIMHLHKKSISSPLALCRKSHVQRFLHRMYMQGVNRIFYTFVGKTDFHILFPAF